MHDRGHGVDGCLRPRSRSGGPRERCHQGSGRYFGPETFEAEWLDGATGPAVGASFRGHVKRNQKGPIYWTTCVVTESEPGKVFEFGVSPPGKATNGPGG